jgi:hypothetical protein
MMKGAYWSNWMLLRDKEHRTRTDFLAWSGVKEGGFMAQSFSLGDSTRHGGSSGLARFFRVGSDWDNKIVRANG